jgi:hypothetical protein
MNIYVVVVFLIARYLDVAKFAVLIPLFLSISCMSASSFPLVGLEIPSYLSTLAMKLSNINFIWHLGNLFVVQVVLHTIDFILGWGTNVQNTDITPATYCCA